MSSAIRFNLTPSGWSVAIGGQSRIAFGGQDGADAVAVAVADLPAFSALVDQALADAKARGLLDGAAAEEGSR